VEGSEGGGREGVEGSEGAGVGVEGSEGGGWGVERSEGGGIMVALRWSTVGKKRLAMSFFKHRI
jgi:hypothetical protein